MKNILIIINLLFITSFPVANLVDYSKNQVYDLIIVDNVINDSICITFSHSDKVIKNKLSFAGIYFHQITEKNLYIDSYISTIKRNSLLMTIKYGSTLILLS